MGSKESGSAGQEECTKQRKMVAFTTEGNNNRNKSNQFPWQGLYAVGGWDRQREKSARRGKSGHQD